MDYGYQVGYLDDGEFVEVGRFNNLDAVENSDLEIRHADSETRVVFGDEGFDFDGSDVAGIEALDVQSASVPQVTSNVDFNSNDATGIGTLEAEALSTEDLGSKTHYAKPDDTQSVRDALERANGEGSSVFVPPGEYELSDHWLVIREGVTFWASPEAKFVRTNADLDTMLANGDEGDEPAEYDGESNITVIGGKWDGRYSEHEEVVTPLAFGHAENITVERVEVFDVGGDWHHGEFNAVKNGKLLNSYLHSQDSDQSSDREMWEIDRSSSGSFPFFGADDGTHSMDITIRDCRFEDGGGCAVGSHSTSSGETYKNITIENCTFRNFDGEAISADNWESVEIVDCEWENCDKGVYATSSGETLESFSVRGGTIREASRGIQFESGGNMNDVTVESVDVYEISIHGVGFDEIGSGITAENVTVKGADRTGMWVGFGGASNIQITNCCIEDTGRDHSTQEGIRFSGGGGEAQDVIVRGNIVESSLNTQETNLFDGGVVSNNILGSVETDSGANVFNNIIDGSFVESGTGT